ncbi:hypothetical protein KI655_12660 [Vibrio sp. D404a]|uniref:hypothetical protein n=1 Tax=unclassified Vibrio TaxID=2614977 RepID=UPI002552FED7|nr:MULTISPECIES: hypothetical protein [unclassified Vibrio]MDK9738148.1 hypothetical protein [Vibrio sp. D404a]MDK9796439.1 hypothetical protein [Vibrio sp. D449a]
MSTLLDAYERKSTLSRYWHNKACDLWASAKILWDAMEDDSQARITSHSTYLMLMGMSFEVLFKAHCVAQGIEDERLKNTHELAEIARIAGFKLSKEDNKVMSVLSAYIVWDGRYPIPKKSSQFQQHTKNIESTAYDKEKFGGFDMLTPNDILKFDNLHVLWRRYSDRYMSEYH